MHLTPEQLQQRILELWQEQGAFLLERTKPTGFPFAAETKQYIYEVLTVDKTCLKAAVGGINHKYALLVIEMNGFCENFYSESWQITTYYDGAGRAEILLK